MTIEEAIQPVNLVSIIGSLITAAISIQLFFLKWIKDGFSKSTQAFDRLSVTLSDQGRQMYEWLRDHEEKDQNRHEQNLARFEKINLTLARAKLENGSTLHH